MKVIYRFVYGEVDVWGATGLPNWEFGVHRPRKLTVYRQRTGTPGTLGKWGTDHSLESAYRSSQVVSIVL